MKGSSKRRNVIRDIVFKKPIRESFLEEVIEYEVFDENEGLSEEVLKDGQFFCMYFQGNEDEPPFGIFYPDDGLVVNKQDPNRGVQLDRIINSKYFKDVTRVEKTFYKGVWIYWVIDLKNKRVYLSDAEYGVYLDIVYKNYVPIWDDNKEFEEDENALV